LAAYEDDDMIASAVHPLAQIQDMRALARLLEVDYATELAYILYRMPKSSKYKSFEIKKKSGGTRTIDAPTRSIRSIQKKLLLLLNTLYTPPPYVHGYSNSRSIITNATYHVRRSYIVNIDLLDFFPSIHFKRVFNILTSGRYGLSPAVAVGIAQICCHNGRLPVGAPTSGIISNIVCAPLDSDIGRHAKKHGLRYSRYADDITFSSSNERAIAAGIGIQINNRTIIHDSSEIGPTFMGIINGHGFQINPKKFQLRSNSSRQEVTGLVVNKKVNVSREYFRSLRGAIHAIEEYGYKKAEQKYESDYSRSNWSTSLEENVIGRLAHLGNVCKYDDRYMRLAHRAANLFPDRQLHWPPHEPSLCALQLTTILDNDEGTAFHIGDGLFVTAAHVFDRNSEVRTAQMRRPHVDMDLITANVVNIDYGLDIAVMKCSNIEKANKVPVVRLTDRPILVGDVVSAYGFPQYNEGNSCSIISARVTGDRQLGILRKEVDRAFAHGASGAPVFDSHGIPVGVVHSGPQLGDIDAPMSTTFTPYSIFKGTLRDWVTALKS
jgi:RNA-directed DNA polymerase